MTKMESCLNNQMRMNEKIEHQLKSRSIVFLDHLGCRTVQQCLDHQQIIKVAKKFKRNYIPKYLQKWIKFGIMDGESISSLTDLQLKSTVQNFPNGQEILCYGDIIAWVG